MRRLLQPSGAGFRWGHVLRHVVLGALALGLMTPLTPADAQNGTIPRLEGQTWVRVMPLEGAAMVKPMEPAQTLAIRAGGVSGSTGCNGYGGTADFHDGLFKLGPLRMSRRACEAHVMEAEQDYMARLSSTAQWWVRGHDLYLANAQGTPLLRFIRD